MKNTKIILVALAFVGAFASAFATNARANFNIYTKTTEACHLIDCNRLNVENLGACLKPGPYYTNPQCTIVATQAFRVIAL